MRIQIASDLHLELLSDSFPGETIIRPAHQADVLVLAGDIARGCEVVNLFEDWPVPVLFVAGNHEFYQGRIEATLDSIRTKAAGTSVRLLEREVADFGGTRFLGCTLWTDYLLNGIELRATAMKEAARFIRDHRVIRMNSGDRFTPEDALEVHRKSRAWLQEQLAKPYDGKTVVVTHHAPHANSIHPRHPGSLLGGEGDNLNAAFASDVTELLGQADLWIHGHVHDSVRYQINDCQVVANPAGYVRGRFKLSNVAGLKFEKPNFEFACVVDTADLQQPSRC
ncbi:MULTISPECIES: metallophosphoesterase [unclassified Caballeronia]|uniref:metallophosphoesterase n=1 Tax=unclassified Caballeronia TaxID=2646786 RepID=UPI0020279F96|nr:MULTISPECIES: metallophosphoesterase [unclassified Caballeronia]MDR5765900.1 metallophosphoesterase [Caballeronia sp. LZ028]